MPNRPPGRQSLTLAAVEVRYHTAALLDLVGLNEAARMAGVTRQRMFVLAQRVGFPEPVAKVETGRLWLRKDVAKWLRSWDRTPGRPTKKRRAKNRG